MVIWQIRGDEIGPNGNGAMYCETKEEAMRFIREYRKERPDSGLLTNEPEKITIRNRADACRELNDAMGYGCS